MKIEFYYSPKDKPSERFPASVDNILKKLNELQQLGVRADAIDVNQADGSWGSSASRRPWTS